MEPTRVLLVDSDRTFRQLLADQLAQRGFSVACVAGVAQARALLDERTFEVAIVALRLGNDSGMDVLHHARKHRPDVAVVILTSHGTIASAIEATRAEAFDYLRKPCEIAELEVVIFRSCEHQRLLQRNAVLHDGLTPAAPVKLVGDSESLTSMRRLLKRVGPTNSTVFIFGEIGVGKEVVV